MKKKKKKSLYLQYNLTSLILTRYLLLILIVDYINFLFPDMIYSNVVIATPFSSLNSLLSPHLTMSVNLNLSPRPQPPPSFLVLHWMQKQTCWRIHNHTIRSISCINLMTKDIFYYLNENQDNLPSISFYDSKYPSTNKVYLESSFQLQYLYV